MPKTNSDGFVLYETESDRPDPEILDNLSAIEGSPSGEAKGKKPKGSGRSIGKAHAGQSRKGPDGKFKIKYSMDDMGNAQRLVDEFGHDMRWSDAHKDWFIWNGKVWTADSHEAARRAMLIPSRVLADYGKIAAYTEDDSQAKELKAWAQTTGMRSRLAAMLEVGRSFKGIAVEAYGFNPDKNVINCPNGVIVLGDSGVVFRPVSRTDMVTKSTRCEYREGARSALWDDFLDKFLPDEEIRTWAQKVAGYSVLGQNPERKIVFCWGGTSSGKSTFAEIMKLVLGTYGGSFNLSLFRENQDERSRPDIVSAMDQRVIFASETSHAWKLHGDMIKRATGKDSIRARMPHSGVMIDRVPDYTPWIVMNNPPTIENADLALYRRLCVVPFPHTIAEDREDVNFRERLESEESGGGGLSAVLAWLVEGWNKYAEEGFNNVPAKVQEWTKRLRDNLSDFDAFLAECCKVEKDASVVPGDLYARYESWCEVNGIGGRDKMTGTAMGRALGGKGFGVQVVKPRGGKGKSERRRIGLRLL